MKLILASDTHGFLDVIARKLKPADALILAGDLTMQGTVAEIKELNEHMGQIKNRYTYGIFMTPGNHDELYESHPGVARTLTTNATVLIDESIIIGGKKFYFSPWQKWCWDWSFGFSRKDDGTEATLTWSKIPNDTEVLVVHGPARGIHDLCPNGDRAGCSYLLKRIWELPNLKLFVSGHIHTGHRDVGSKVLVKDGITFVNASICDEEYQPVQEPVELEII